MTSILRLSPAVQRYAWGKVGLDSEVAKLFKSNSDQPVDEATPYAEVCDHYDTYYTLRYIIEFSTVYVCLLVMRKLLDSSGSLPW